MTANFHNPLIFQRISNSEARLSKVRERCNRAQHAFLLAVADMALKPRDRIGSVAKMSMRIVQTTEAKTRLAELLRTVERGETVTITRRGRTIAHMVPASQEDDPVSHRRAMKRFLRHLDKLEPCAMSIEDIVRAKNDGRRY